MDSPKPPAQPDPIATANAQGAANIDAARVTANLNRVNQNTPFGSLTYTQDPNNKDQFTSSINLDPRLQGLLDSQLQTSNQTQGAIQTSLGQVNQTLGQSAPTADEATRQRVTDALYGQARSRLDPQFGQQEQSLRSDLMNRGIVEGSDAWKNQLDNFNRSKNDAYSTALSGAIGAGGNEMRSDVQSQLGIRDNVLNELNSLRTGSQVAAPNFGQTPSGASVNPAPVAQSIYNGYQGALGQYNAQVGSNNATMGALGTLGAGAMMGLGGAGGVGATSLLGVLAGMF